MGAGATQGGEGNVQRRPICEGQHFVRITKGELMSITGHADV
jgi:hypothetical protein